MSTEYGWTDDVIWDLPLARFRQITAAIQSRRYLQDRAENSRVSWLGRTISTFIAAGYMVEGNKENTGLTSASRLGYDDVERALVGGQSAEPDKQPLRYADPNAPRPTAPDIDPEEAIRRALARNSNGSFERFMTMGRDLEVRGNML